MATDMDRVIGALSWLNKFRKKKNIEYLENAEIAIAAIDNPRLKLEMETLLRDFNKKA